MLLPSTPPGFAENREKSEKSTATRCPAPSAPLSPFDLDVPENPAKSKKSTAGPALFWVSSRRGDYLGVRSDDGRSGWVLADKMIVKERAIEFFTNQIRANSRDALLFATPRCCVATRGTKRPRCPTITRPSSSIPKRFRLRQPRSHLEQQEGIRQGGC